MRINVRDAPPSGPDFIRGYYLIVSYFGTIVKKILKI